MESEVSVVVRLQVMQPYNFLGRNRLILNICEYINTEMYEIYRDYSGKGSEYIEYQIKCSV